MDTEKNLLADKVMHHILANDLFTQWLGITITAISEGYCKMELTVRKEMMNGLGIVHGGIAFSMADSCFAYACNSRNVLSVALDTNINFIKPVHAGDRLVAETKELHNGQSTGLYQVTITNQNQHVVALFKGTCFKTKKAVV